MKIIIRVRVKETDDIRYIPSLLSLFSLLPTPYFEVMTFGGSPLGFNKDSIMLDFKEEKK